jgi:hypothetical protein
VFHACPERTCFLIADVLVVLMALSLVLGPVALALNVDLNKDAAE